MKMICSLSAKSTASPANFMQYKTLNQSVFGNSTPLELLMKST